jgi:DNA-directed RNA polymerase specialized sigma24 family protein
VQAVRSRETAARDYERHQRAVMGMLAKRFPRFDENERLEIYHEAWARVFAKRARGEEIHSLRAYLLQTAAAEAMNAVTRGRPPVPIGPDDPAVTTLADGEATVEERVLMRDQVRLARELIDSLDGRQRDLLKLRWDLQLNAHEIRAALGLTHRQYQRLAEEGAAAIASRVRDLEDGTWSRRQRSLLTACLIEVADVDGIRAGIASEEQRAEAQRLLDSDPHVAALYVEVRGALRRAAAILPLPAIPVGDGLLNAWILDRVTTLSDQAGAVAGAAKQQVTGAYLRVADMTLLAGASPGAVAATAAVGLAVVGGGAYVTAQGLPGQSVPKSTLQQTPHVRTTQQGEDLTRREVRTAKAPARDKPGVDVGTPRERKEVSPRSAGGAGDLSTSPQASIPPPPAPSPASPSPPAKSDAPVTEEFGFEGGP